MTTDMHVFCSRARQRPLGPRETPIKADTLPIKLKLFELVVTESETDVVIYGVPHHVTERLMDVQFSRVKVFEQEYKEVMAGNLSSMDIPEEDQIGIIDKLVKVLDDEVVPELPITVVIVDVTVRTTPGGSMCGCKVMIDETRWKSMERYRDDDPYLNWYYGIMEAVELVPLSSYEDAIRRTQCLRCKKSLDHQVAGNLDILDWHHIARLPCSHFFYRRCVIGRWLQTSYLCPCRHPIVDEKPEFLSIKYRDRDMLEAMTLSALGDTSLEKDITERQRDIMQLRKLWKKTVRFLYFLFAVYGGYNLLVT